MFIICFKCKPSHYITFCILPMFSDCCSQAAHRQPDTWGERCPHSVLHAVGSAHTSQRFGRFFLGCWQSRTLTHCHSWSPFVLCSHPSPITTTIPDHFSTAFFCCYYSPMLLYCLAVDFASVVFTMEIRSGLDALLLNLTDSHDQTKQILIGWLLCMCVLRHSLHLNAIHHLLQNENRLRWSMVN